MIVALICILTPTSPSSYKHHASGTSITAPNPSVPLLERRGQKRRGGKSKSSPVFIWWASGPESGVVLKERSYVTIVIVLLSSPRRVLTYSLHYSQSTSEVFSFIQFFQMLPPRLPCLCPWTAGAPSDPRFQASTSSRQSWTIPAALVLPKSFLHVLLRTLYYTSGGEGGKKGQSSKPAGERSHRPGIRS